MSELNSIETEKAILGIVVADSHKLYEAQALGLRGEHFYRHRELFELLCEMLGAAEEIDAITVPQRVNGHPRRENMGGVSYVLSIVGEAPPSGGLASYVRIVMDLWQRRAVLAALEGAAEGLRDTNARSAEQAQVALVDAIQSVQLRPAGAWVDLATIVDGVETQAAIHPADRKAAPALSTGFVSLDEVVGGMYPGDLVLLAARPSMGKSALALNIAEHAARNGHRVGVFSLEMPKDSVAQRMLAGAAGVPLGIVRNGVTSKRDLDRIRAASVDLRALPMHIDDASGITVGELVARASRLQALYGDVKMIVVDYLQLLTADHRSQSREQDVAAISSRLKSWAKNSGIPVLCLCQLNRGCEERKDKKPILSDLRESGSLEQDADQVWLVFRPAQYWPDAPEHKGKAEVLVVKNRNGSLGEVHMGYIGDQTKFIDAPDNYGGV